MLFQGTWGDFGYTPSYNPYWKGSGITAGSLFTKGTSSWYPASGLRNGSSGTLANVFVIGYYWSASPCNESSNARDLYFSSSNVLPEHYDYRSYGLPVRCVQE